MKIRRTPYFAINAGIKLKWPARNAVWKGIEILKNLKLKPYYSQGYLFLGELYKDSDQREKALEYLKKAAEYFREMEMDYWLDKTRAVLEGL